jgi:Polyketide cyclase / dehydrase and lipid transport
MSLTSIALYGLGAVFVLAAGTMLLPRHVSVQRHASIKGDASAIITMAASNEGYQRFNPYKNSDPNLKTKMIGPASGVGSGFKFESKDGSGTQTVTAVTADTVTYAIDLGAMGKPTSSIAVAPDSGKTKVTWRTDMDMGFNPIGRVMGLFMDGMLGKTYETGLKNIEAVVNS